MSGLTVLQLNSSNLPYSLSVLNGTTSKVLITAQKNFLTLILKSISGFRKFSKLFIMNKKVVKSCFCVFLPSDSWQFKSN